MKAADYRIPWGRPSEHLLAVKREIVGQQMHVQRVHEARNRATIDTETPECAQMPHLVTRPKKKKMQEDRQREIAAENYSLMHRLAGIMREKRGDPVQKFAHLSVEYRESLRRKKLLKLEAENRRLARSIKKQQPFYATGVMEKEEDERQLLLKTMSRTQRRKERASLFAAASRVDRKSERGGCSRASIVGENSAGTATSSLVEDGVLFRPGPSVVSLRTAKQMQSEVAKRRGQEQTGYFSSGGGGGGGHDVYGGSGDGSKGITGTRYSATTTTTTPSSCAAGSITVGVSSRGSTGCEGGLSTTSAGGVKHSSAIPAGRGGGVVLEVNRTGGRGRRTSGGGRRATTGEGRPNMIFTPSLVPVGMESVRACPMSLGGVDSRPSAVKWGAESGTVSGGGDAGGESERGEGGGGGIAVAEGIPFRDTRTV